MMLAETINEIGSSIRRVMGGTSGIMYDIFFKAAYAHLKVKSESVVTPLSWADALEYAIAAIIKYGGASAGYHTMLDALIPVTSVLKEVLFDLQWRLTISDDPIDCFVLSSVAALTGAVATKNMQVQGYTMSFQDIKDAVWVVRSYIIVQDKMEEKPLSIQALVEENGNAKETVQKKSENLVVEWRWGSWWRKTEMQKKRSKRKQRI